MGKSRKKYFAGYYKKNRDKKLAYQNEYYRRMKEYNKENLELLKLLEPEEYEKKMRKYRDYQRKYREKKANERYNLNDQNDNFE